MVYSSQTSKQPDDTTTVIDSNSQDEVQVSKTPKRSFRSFIWDTDSHLKSPEEKRLLLKLDAAILSIGCLGFFMKYLDQGNLSNAYVSGLQEALSMYGNEYTYAQTVYTVAYAAMQIPSTLIVQRVRPSIWLAAMEVGWAIFTFAQAGMNNVSELYAFRFLVGFFESSFFPVLLYVLGSWYTKTELAKRVALFHMTAPLGSAFGGYLQAAVYKNMNGAHGLAGWRWLYLICGCMTLPVGIATYFLLPDTPYTTRVWFLSKRERELAQERVLKAGKAAPVKITLKTFKKILGSWKWYAFVLGYVIYMGSSSSGMMILPTEVRLGFKNFTDKEISRQVFGLLPNGILAFWPESLRLKEFAFLTVAVQLMTAVFALIHNSSYTWANEVCAGDNEERAVVVSSMNGFQYAVAAWLPILIFPQTMAPTFRYGFPATFGLVIAAIISVIAIQVLVKVKGIEARQSEIDRETE
ncbi:unnamed protein product [Penicillium bialowiezense]